MANGTARRETVTIAVEDSYGVTSTGTKFVLPIIGDPTITPRQTMLEDTAMLGSTYGVDKVRRAVRWAEFTISLKADEDTLPLFFMQKYSDTPTLVSGESAVYKHTMAYKNTNAAGSKGSYSMFIDDPDVVDNYLDGCRFSGIKITATPSAWFMVELTGMGRFPTDASVTNTISARTNDFVGRHANFEIADLGSGPTQIPVLSMTATQTFNMSGDDINFILGNEDIDELYTLTDRFETDITAKYTDTSIRDDWKADQSQNHKLEVIDTDRFVTGSTQSTRPSIAITYPESHIIEWNESMTAENIRTQAYKLLAVDNPAVATSPAVLEIVNAVASY